MKKLVLILLFLSLCFLYAEDDIDLNLPAWVLFEKGKSLYEEKDFGLSLLYFKTALKKQKDFPEAEYWTGKIFEIEGEFALAEKQYKKTLLQKENLYIPDTKYEIMFTLAKLYYNTERFELYEETLLKIINDDDNFSKTGFAKLKSNLINTLNRNGLDKALYSYRLNSLFANKAYLDLGIYKLNNNDYSKAQIYLAFYCINVFSKAISYLKEKDIEYEFESIDKVFKKAKTDAYLKDYFIDSNVFEGLYYLGKNYYKDSKPEIAYKIWFYIVKSGFAGLWEEKAFRAANDED